MAVHRRSHAFIVRDGKILVLQNAGGSRWWGQPGGDIEADESAAETVTRETREETGLRITNPELLRTWQYHDRRGDIVACHSYAAYAPPGDVILSEEHSAYAWMSVDEYAARYCGDRVAAVVPPWAQLFLAEMRENCALFRA